MIGLRLAAMPNAANTKQSYISVVDSSDLCYWSLCAQTLEAENILSLFSVVGSLTADYLEAVIWALGSLAAMMRMIHSTSTTRDIWVELGGCSDCKGRDS